MLPDARALNFFCALYSRCVSLHYRLEALNERRSGVVQMVKLAEKERDGLEVQIRVLHTWMFSNHCFIQL